MIKSDTMYYSYFNLDKATFSLAPNPPFIFNTSLFLATCSLLLKGFRDGKTLGIITGKTGTGKTALCHYLISQLSTYKVATVNANPLLTTIDFLTAICDQLQIEYPPSCENKDLILDRLHDFFSASRVNNEKIMIFIDEAQYLSKDIFKLLDILISIHCLGKAKQYIILAGQPELTNYMQKINFLSNTGENCISTVLEPMSKQDTIAYINHRLDVGGAKDPIFTPPSELAIYQYTNGIPRLINIICDHCLRIAQQRKESIVTPQTVRLAYTTYSPSRLQAEKSFFKQALIKLKGTTKNFAGGVSNKKQKASKNLDNIPEQKQPLINQEKQKEPETVTGSISGSNKIEKVSVSPPQQQKTPKSPNNVPEHKQALKNQEEPKELKDLKGPEIVNDTTESNKNLADNLSNKIEKVSLSRQQKPSTKLDNIPEPEQPLKTEEKPKESEILIDPESNNDSTESNKNLANSVPNKIKQVSQPQQHKTSKSLTNIFAQGKPLNIQEKPKVSEELKKPENLNVSTQPNKLKEPIKLTKNRVSEKDTNLKDFLGKTTFSTDTEVNRLTNRKPPLKLIVSDDNITHIDVYPQGISIPEGMVIVPQSTLDSAYNDTKMNVATFLLDQTPVTNKQYTKYIEETNRLPPDHWWAGKISNELLDHPVVGISYKDAYAFARWSDKRLPTPIEWEAASRRPGNRKFPWGDNWEISHLNCVESGLKKTTAVDYFPAGASLDGCLDLLGNVWEWTDAESKKTTIEAKYAFVFGGSFRHESVINGAIARTALLQLNCYAYVGFRCARDIL